MCLIIDLAQAEGPIPGVLCDFPDGRPPLSETGHFRRHQAHQGKATTRLGLSGVECRAVWWSRKKMTTTLRTIKNKIVMKKDSLHIIKKLWFLQAFDEDFFKREGINSLNFNYCKC